MFKAITPKFINKLDHYLLVNHPTLWISKIHYVLWYGALMWALSALLGAIMPIDLKSRIEYGLWYFLFTVVSVIIFCFWIYHYIIFNKEKKYGNRNITDEYKNFLLVFLSVFIFAAVPWPFEIIYTQRIASIVEDEQFIQDMNVLNENEPYMVNSYGVYYTWQDSLTHEQFYNIHYLNSYAGSNYTPYQIRYDTIRFPQMKKGWEIVREYKPITDPDKLIGRIESYIAVAEKYDVQVDESARNIANRYLELLNKGRLTHQDFTQFNYTNKEYVLSTIFNNVGEAKFSTLFIFKNDALWALFYVTITLTSFLLLFKITYWQQFLVTMVVLAIYPLLVFILSELSPYNSVLHGETFMMFCLLAAIFYSGTTMFNTLFGNKYFRPFYNITNQVFYLTLVSWPVLFIVFLRATTNIFHQHDYTSYYYYPSANVDYTVVNAEAYIQNNLPSKADILSGMYYDYWYAEFKRWVEYAQWFGIVAFIVSLPFMKWIFIKQISLPKKR